MKMKKLLILSIASMMLLGACKVNKGKEESGGNYSGDEQSEGTSSESESLYSVYDGAGETDGFPMDIVEEFMANYDLDYDVVAYEGKDDVDWQWEAGIDDDGYAYLYVGTDDYDDTPMMNTYAQTLNDNGIEAVYVDPDDYYAYYEVRQDGELAYYFLTVASENVFYISFNGPNVWERVSDEFPMERFDSFCEDAHIFFSKEVPAPVSDYEWRTIVSLDNSYFLSYTKDEGTFGEDSIADVWFEEFEELGWFVDDSSADNGCYHAYYADLEIEFGLEDGEFYVYAINQFEIWRSCYSYELPVDTIIDFLNRSGFSIDTFPSLESETGFTYYLDSDTDGNYMNISCDDEGAPSENTLGDNAIEDQFKELLESDGWEIDDSKYDSVGYYGYYDDISIIFFSWEGEFCLYINGHMTEDVNAFPETAFSHFLAMEGIETEVPAPFDEVSCSWTIDGYTGYTRGPVFYLEAVDHGTNGINAIEDSYYDILEEAGFELDDTYYDYDGYYAYGDDVTILFFSWDGYFCMYVWAI